MQPFRVPTPDFLALNGKVVVLDDTEDAESVLRIEPKTNTLLRSSSYGIYASWIVHAKGPFFASLQSFAFRNVYLCVNKQGNASEFMLGGPQELRFSIFDGNKVSCEGVQLAVSVLDNSLAAAFLSHEGILPAAIATDWQAMDGARICLEAPRNEGCVLLTDQMCIDCSPRCMRELRATWEISYIAPGRIALENLYFTDVYLSVVDGHFGVVLGEKYILLERGNQDGTISIAGVNLHLALVNNPRAMRSAVKLL